MSKMQINLHQSEILMALRSILNCSNDELIPRVTELAERHKPKKPVKRMSGERECPNCEIALARNYLIITFCPNCGQRLDWSE